MPVQPAPTRSQQGAASTSSTPMTTPGTLMNPTAMTAPATTPNAAGRVGNRNAETPATERLTATSHKPDQREACARDKAGEEELSGDVEDDHNRSDNRNRRSNNRQARCHREALARGDSRPQRGRCQHPAEQSRAPLPTSLMKPKGPPAAKNTMRLTQEPRLTSPTAKASLSSVRLTVAR